MIDRDISRLQCGQDAYKAISGALRTPVVTLAFNITIQASTASWSGLVISNEIMIQAPLSLFYLFPIVIRYRRPKTDHIIALPVRWYLRCILAVRSIVDVLMQVAVWRS
jgi:hypothetical protein